jgi:hypothetical protein
VGVPAPRCVPRRPALRQPGRLRAGPAALRHHQDALHLASEAGYRQGEAAALIGLAQAQAGLRRYDEAGVTIDQALLTTRQTGLRLLEGLALTARAAIALDSGLAGDAETGALEALAVRTVRPGAGRARAARCSCLSGPETWSRGVSKPERPGTGRPFRGGLPRVLASSMK